MNKRVVAACGLVVTAIVVACLWVPCVPDDSRTWVRLIPNAKPLAIEDRKIGWPDYFTADGAGWPEQLHFRWIGQLDDDLRPPPRLTAYGTQRANIRLLSAFGASIHTPTLLAELGLLLLIGGGLLTFLIRRDRRRRADSVPSV